MNEQELEQIEKYLGNALSDVERAAFEQALENNPALRRELERHRLAMRAIRLKGREQLRQRWAVPPGAPAMPAARSSFGRIIRAGGLAFATVMVVVLALWWWRGGQPAIDRPALVPADTVHAKPAEPALLPVSPPDSVRTVPIARDAPADTEKLFAAYFRPYRDESMNPTVRDNPAGGQSAFNKFQQLYWERRYDKALSAFEALDPVLRQNDNLLFMKANLLLAAGQTDQAAALLKAILRNNRSGYVGEARWYEMLCYLKKGDWPAVKIRLERILAIPDDPHRKEAARLLSQIK